MSPRLKLKECGIMKKMVKIIEDLKENRENITGIELSNNSLGYEAALS
jgi:hypothetical protein